MKWKINIFKRKSDKEAKDFTSLYFPGNQEKKILVLFYLRVQIYSPNLQQLKVTLNSITAEKIHFEKNLILKTLRSFVNYLL